MTWYLGNSPMLMIYHSEPLKEILTNTTTLMNKSSAYNPLVHWIGTGLLTSRMEKWQNRRKLLTPAFHFRILDDALLTFNEQVRN